MQYNNLSKTKLFHSFRNQYLTISLSNNILVLSFILLFSFLLTTNSFDDANDNAALAFKPTIPNDQQQSQQQQQSQKQQPTNSMQISEEYVSLKKLGSQGNGIGQFAYPSGIAIDTTGNVYVADTDNNRIQKFDSNGNFITKWGISGNKDGEFDSSEGCVNLAK